MSGILDRSDAEDFRDGIDTQRALATLRVALESPQFCNSPRQAALLRYIVTEECEGRGEKLNAYGIAFDVFDRDSSFNPAIDSIVRVEMHRLRGSLQAWGADPANPLSDRLEIRPWSYRPRLVERGNPVEVIPQTDRRRSRRSIWIAMGAAAGAITLIGSAVSWHNRTELCRSARPELDLPQAVANLPRETSALVITRIKEMLEYYPLVTGGNHGFSQCAGVPKYDLAMMKGPLGLNMTLTARENGAVLQTFDVPYDPNGSTRDQDIAAARIAFQLGHDNGYIANDALRRNWSDRSAEGQFVCLMGAHKYFYANAGPTTYAAVRSCLIKEFRRSSMADVPALLAAFELEPRFNPRLRRYQTHDYFDEAVKVASGIDRYNAELIVAQLRAMRLQATLKRGDVQVAIQTLDSVYPYEPYIRNQVAITQCKVTQEYPLAYRNISLYKEILMEDIDLPYAEFYCNVATDNIEMNRKYFEKMLNDTSPYIQLLNLYVAEKLNDAAMKRQVLARLKQLNCTDRACLLGMANEIRENPDIYNKLRSAIDRQFPAGTQLIDQATPAAAADNAR
ncbi:MAG: hypothetical protein JSR96_03605 [Proteobacteria bacterium]|nr:hypothetical protein [Pseudomonadota bacterium]